MTEQTAEQEEAFSDNLRPHLAALFVPKSIRDDRNMRRLQKNTEISAFSLFWPLRTHWRKTARTVDENVTRYWTMLPTLIP